MKDLKPDFNEININEGVGVAEEGVEKRASPMGADASKDIVEKLQQQGSVSPKVEAANETLEALEPQTNEQEEKIGFLQRVKSFFGSKTPEQYMTAGLKAINAHPAKLKMYEQFVATDSEKAAKYAMAVGKNPGVNYFKYDEAKQDFVDSTRYSVASGEGLSGQ